MVHILASGMRDQNPRGFLFPILHGRKALAAAGVGIRVFRAPDDAIADCDALLIDSKALDAVMPAEADQLAAMATWKRACPVGYFDLTDSATQVRADFIRPVTLYFKNQLVRDRGVLRRPLYGHRLYTDFYHRHDGVLDDVPASSTPLSSDEDLKRLRVSWNAGLANYAAYGPRVAVLYDQVRASAMLFYPRRFRDPAAPRNVAVSCRMNAVYPRRTVAHQRVRAKAVLERYAAAGRISKRRYFQELRRARLTISPFGWGEINQKDFEGFLLGTAIVKPDVSHLDTWPDLFQAGSTYIPFRWDFSDLLDTIGRYLANDSERLAIARQGQERYRFHVATAAGHDAFRQRLLDILRDLQRQWHGDRNRAPRRSVA